MQQAKKKGHKQATPAEVKEKVKKSIKKLIIEQVKASKPEFTYQEAEVVAEIELVKEEQQQQIETLTIAAVKFQEKEAAAKVHAAKTEAKFEILLKNGTRLGGAWDRINIDKQTGEVSIIEYKTSLKRQNPLNLYLQTLIYALVRICIFISHAYNTDWIVCNFQGYQRTHNKIPDHVVVEAINSQSSFRITYSEDNLKTAEALLMALTDHINQEEAFPAQPSRAVCDSCPYSNVCPSVLPQQAFDRPFVFREPRTNNKNGVKVNA
jgi:RecB family exonuclease